MKSRKFIVSIAVLMVYMGIIFFLSNLSGDLLSPERVYGFDIDALMKHFLEFSVLGILVTNFSWQLTEKNSFRRDLVTFFSSSAFSASYGILDEFHQYFVPTRYCTFFDMLTDIVGSITGVFIFLLFAHMKVKDRKIL
jgi:VanZ family protein